MDKTALKERYEGTPANKQEEFRNTVKKACGWSRSTFWRKLRKPESIKELELEKLETLFTPIINYKP